MDNIEEVSCKICYEENIKFIVCPNETCDTILCEKCFKDNLLSFSPLRCMGCEKYFGIEYLYKNIDEKWMHDEYPTSMKKYLITTEKPLFEETHQIIIKKKKIDNLKYLIREVENTLHRIKYEDRFELEQNTFEFENLQKKQLELATKIDVYHSESIKIEFNKVRSELNKLRTIKKKLETKMQDNQILRVNMIKLLKQYKGELTEISDKEEKIINLGMCPESDCKGIIIKVINGTKITYECCICNHRICHKCRESIKNDDADKHICDKNILESVNAVKKESKGCPKCNASIGKVSGCDQMFCTLCNTLFSWSTGKIVHEPVHNPYALEYLRKTNALDRDINDVPCGGLISWSIVDNMVKKSKVIKISRDNYRMIHQIWEFCDSIQHQITINNPQIDTFDLRIKYLKNSITEEKWVNDLYKIYLENEARKIKVNVLITLRTLLVERFRNLVEDTSELELKTVMFISEAERIRMFVNECLSGIKFFYKKDKNVNLNNKWDQI